MLISVAIPTFKRLPQLKRAVADVMAQTWHDWELVISDDDPENGDTWEYLQSLANSDHRVKILKNTRGRHGQVYNVNSVVSMCSGDWIKPFFDDDRMLPECLAEFVETVSNPLVVEHNVVMVGCRAERWRNGKKVGDDPNFVSHEIEVITAGNTLRAMCLFDRWNGRTPTHVMIRGDVIRAGTIMVEDDFVRHPIDVRWFGRVLEHGAYAMISKVLVRECQGEVESGTSQLWREEGRVTEENRKVYLEIYDRVKDKDSNWPIRRSIDAMICTIRGLYHLRRRQLWWGIKYLFLSLRSPYGIILGLRACKSIAHPGTYAATERIFV